MKRYPNQISNFETMRRALQVVYDIDSAGVLDATDDEDLGYELVEQDVIGFRDLPETATKAQKAARVAEERLEKPSNQSPQTTARDLRRTLYNLGWLDSDAKVTDNGAALLDSKPRSIEEQSLLVEALLDLQATNRDGSSPHHPIQTMLRLLAVGPAQNRDGLELALEPADDSLAEFDRVKKLYLLPRAQRIAKLGINEFKRANAVKILPSLAVAAGLVLREEIDNWYSLSQDGWRVIGETPNDAKQAIAKRRGRRTTVGKLVTSKTVAGRHGTVPPKSLTDEEQRRAAEKLRERTTAHQELVKRVAEMIGDGNGSLFEDPFSYDLLWVPDDDKLSIYLFEMKTIEHDTDAYARVRDAVGQLSYYDYFYVAPTWISRPVVKIGAFSSDIPSALVDYLDHEMIGVIVAPVGVDPRGLNPRGKKLLALLL